MNTQSLGLLSSKLVLGGFVVLVLVSCGLTVVLFWTPGSRAAVSDDSAMPPLAVETLFSPAFAEGETRVREKCEECGIVESTRLIAPGAAASAALAADGVMKRGDKGVAPPVRRYEVMVRKHDGAIHVFIDANSENAPNWRAGERVTLIEDTRPMDF